MKEDEIIQNLVKDIAVELTDEFDRNFERKAFFDEMWKTPRFPDKNGSLMNRSGSLRRSVYRHIIDTTISWQSSLPYSEIHNTGGTITVTQKMKSFFWAMYYKNAGTVVYDVKTKSAIYDDKAKLAMTEANLWKALALKKVGDKITIPKRQFIGNHPQVNQVIQNCFKSTKQDIEQFMNQQFGL